SNRFPPIRGLRCQNRRSPSESRFVWPSKRRGFSRTPLHPAIWRPGGPVTSEVARRAFLLMTALRRVAGRGFDFEAGALRGDLDAAELAVAGRLGGLVRQQPTGAQIAVDRLVEAGKLGGVVGKQSQASGGFGQFFQIVA